MGPLDNHTNMRCIEIGNEAANVVSAVHIVDPHTRSAAVSASNIPSGIAPERSDPSLPEQAALERDLSRLMAESGAPGMAVEIAIRGEHRSISLGRLSLAGNSAMTADAQFSVVCLVRFLVSLACLRLAADARLNLDSPIGEYIPELGSVPGTKGAMITVRHLLSQTAGFSGLARRDGSRTEWPWERCITYIKDAPQPFYPGTVFSEEHLNHILLGRILQAVTGQSALAFVQEQLLSPLGVHPGLLFDEAIPVERRVLGHRFSTDNLEMEVVPDRAAEPDDWLPALSNMTMTVKELSHIAQFLSGLSSSGASADELRVGIGTDLLTPYVSFRPYACARSSLNWLPRKFTSCCAQFANNQYGYFSAARGQCTAIVFDVGINLSVALAANIAGSAFRARALDIIYSHIFGTDWTMKEGGLAGPSDAYWDYAKFINPFQPHQLAGGYIGTTKEIIRVGVKEDRLRITAERLSPIRLGPLQNGRMMIDSRRPFSLAFFQDPRTGVPCIMLGVTAFRKRHRLK